MKYTQEQKDWVKANGTLPRKELTEKFNEEFNANCTVSQIAELCKRNKLKASNLRRYTKEQLAWLYENKILMRKVLTEKFNQYFNETRTLAQITDAMRSRKWVSEIKYGHFKKGHKLYFLNTKPIGYERVECGYYLVKIGEPNIWKRKHIVIWEKANGTIPKDMTLRFIDGNPLNCCIENLELVSKDVHLRLNKARFNKLPEEIKPAVKTLAKLQNTISRRQKAEEEK